MRKTWISLRSIQATIVEAVEVWRDLGLVVAQQWNEACLLKVLVMGERLCEISSLHD